MENNKLNYRIEARRLAHIVEELNFSYTALNKDPYYAIKLLELMTDINSLAIKLNKEHNEK